MATLTITGLYNIDNTIFDDMVFPEEFTETNKETAIDEIIFECAELEILYPDPFTMKYAIKRWSEAEQPSWERMYNALLAEYNPLWNVDATVEETANRTEEKTGTGLNSENVGRDYDRSGTDNNTRTDNLTDTVTHNRTVTNTDSDVLSSTAFNVATWRQRDKNEGSTNGLDSGETIDAQTGTVTDARTWSDETDETIARTSDSHTTENSEGEETRSTRRTGNIGVTSSQQLIDAEIQLSKYNIVRTIVDSFKKRFCILVY